MKKKFPIRVISLIIAAITIISVPAMAAGFGEKVYENSTALADSFTYTNFTSYSPSGRIETFAVELKRGSDIEQIVTSCDTIYGGMTVQTAVKYAEDLGYNVLAAVNADFFSKLNHVPLGIVIEDGVYKSSPSGRNAVCIDSAGNTSLAGSVEVTLTLENFGGGIHPELFNAGKTVTVEHLNKYRTDTALYLYSNDFSTISTRAESEGWAVRFKILSGELTVNSLLRLQVEEILENVKDAAIGEGYMVLTAASVSGHNVELEKFAVGDTVQLTTSCADPEVSKAKWANGCGDFLITGGVIGNPDEWDKSIMPANPRTAVGIKQDGSVVYCVSDGRQDGYSRGATLSELAEQLMSMGCIDAANLDGGGSSVMSIRMPGSESCVVVNSPSEGAPRRCGTYVLFTTKNNSDSTARRLFLNDDGEYVLSGSSLELSFSATDSSYRSVSAPPDISVSASSGKISNGVYTAGQGNGIDTLTLRSESSGAKGTGTVHIINSPDEIIVADSATGLAVSGLNLSRGDSLQLSVKAKHFGRKVHLSPDAVSFAVEGDIGTVTPEGVFTAGSKSNVSGSITVSVGKSVRTITVTIPPEPEDTDGHWSQEYVVRLWKTGIVNGISATEFSPDNPLRRCDFILMLYRVAGEPPVEENTNFSDVSDEAYYADAVKWAEANGIARGTDEGTFLPLNTIIREQGFTFLYRYLMLIGSVDESTVGADLSPFTDISNMSDYSAQPISVLVGLRIVGGAEGRLTPLEMMTRGQMAKVLSLASGI